jgi:hypothetical protein
LAAVRRRISSSVRVCSAREDGEEVATVGLEEKTGHTGLARHDWDYAESLAAGMRVEVAGDPIGVNVQFDGAYHVRLQQGVPERRDG